MWKNLKSNFGVVKTMKFKSKPKRKVMLTIAILCRNVTISTAWQLRKRLGPGYLCFPPLLSFPHGVCMFWRNLVHHNWRRNTHPECPYPSPWHLNRSIAVAFPALSLVRFPSSVEVTSLKNTLPLEHHHTTSQVDIACDRYKARIPVENSVKKKKDYWPFQPKEWPASNFSLQEYQWIIYSDHENKGNEC